jgi:hypothetical protein
MNIALTKQFTFAEGARNMDIIGGLEKEHVTLYLEKRVRMLIEKEAKGNKERYSAVVNRVMWEALKGKYNLQGA